MVPLRLMSPHTVFGAPGNLVIAWVGTISRKASISQANALAATSNTKSRRVGTCGSSIATCSGGSVTASLIKAKCLERIGARGQRVLARDYRESAAQVFRERRSEIEWLTRHWVVEREPCRVEEMPLGRKSGQTTSSAAAIDVIAHDRMADRREMNADLVSPSGMEMR